MKIYLTIIEDRHYDTDVFPFSTAEQAIAYARRVEIESARSPEDFEECEVYDGWLYYARYSCEGDCVWVIGKELDAETE